MDIGTVFARGAELVLGARCPGCERPRLGVCPACAARIRGCRPFLVPGQPAPVAAAGVYAGSLRGVLLAAKERSALGMIPLLGSRLAAAVAVLALGEELSGPLLLVPVPSARAQVAQRGIDLTRSLARSAASELSRAGLPTSVAVGLELARRPQDQSDLGRDARWVNLAGAFRGRPGLVGQLVIVDDIVTTGATLAESVRALTEAGSQVRGAATVAATPIRRGARRPGRPA